MLFKGWYTDIEKYLFLKYEEDEVERWSNWNFTERLLSGQLTGNT